MSLIASAGGQDKSVEKTKGEIMKKQCVLLMAVLFWVFTAPPLMSEGQGKPINEPVPLYRYWNPTIGDHYYTTDFNELGNGAQGYLFEGIQGRVFESQQPGLIPLYKYWNPDWTDHFYTTNFNELRNGAQGWSFEWIECNILPPS